MILVSVDRIIVSNFQNRMAAKLFCRSIFLSSFRSVVLSFCCSVVLSFCRSVVLSFCRSVVLSFCRSVGLLFYRYVVLSFCVLCSDGHSSVQSFCRSVLLSFYRSFVLSFFCSINLSSLCCHMRIKPYEAEDCWIEKMMCGLNLKLMSYFIT